MSATDTGAPFQDITGPISDDEATEYFLKNFLPTDAKDEPSDEDEEDKKAQDASDTEDDEVPEPKDSEESADEDQPDGEEDEGEGEKGPEKDRKYASDDVYVKIKVGDEEHSVPVKDLQRLYGQEASLTKKSMEVSEKRKAVEDEFAKASIATSALLQRAKARFEPYSKVDFLLASQQLEPEQYAALRNEALAAHEDVQFLEQHLNGLMGQIQQKKQDDLVNAARESLKVLSGPADKGGIEGWNEKLYDDIRAFAVKEGAPVELVNQVVDPWAIRMMHDAMMFRRGKSKVITKKVNKTPKKVIKSTNASNTNPKGPDADKTAKAMAKLRKSGSADDAAEAFLARWETNDE